MSRPSRRLRILFSEGSSLSARQALYALGPAGHVLDVCDPKPFRCLARYSRYVHACHRCPSFTGDPAGYVGFLAARLAAARYDVLLPVHDQAYLLARFRHQLGRRTGLALPDFAAVERVQSKAALMRLLDELGLPHPPTLLVRTRQELENACRFPCFVKRAFGTAGCGVWLVRDADELRHVADELEQTGELAGRTEVLVQQPAPGVLGVVQTVFQHGRLVAAHCYQARALGVGGSAWARVSVAHPSVLEHVTVLGARLSWQGALMLDYLYDPVAGRPAYIDANPRIGETLNATMSGVNLCDVLVQVALGHRVPRAPPSRTGVRTHSVLMSLLARALGGANRRQLLAELGRAWTHRDLYHHSQDELTRPRDDPLSVLPAALLTWQLLVQPRRAARIVQGTVDNYALSQTAAETIRHMTPRHGTGNLKQSS